MRPSLLVQPQEDLQSSQGTGSSYQCLVPGPQESRCRDAVSQHKRRAPAGETDPPPQLRIQPSCAGAQGRDSQDKTSVVSTDRRVNVPLRSAGRIITNLKAPSGYPNRGQVKPK